MTSTKTNNSNKVSTKRKLYVLPTDSIVIVFIIFASFLLYADLFVPDCKEVNVFNWFTLKSGYFQSVQLMSYFAFNKLAVIIILTTWFLTNKRWWGPVILIPLSIYIFQLLSIVNDELRFFNDFEFYYSLPLLTPVLLGLYFIRKGLKSQSQLDEMNNEITDRLDENIEE